jgi:hypothetical protein
VKSAVLFLIGITGTSPVMTSEGEWKAVAHPASSIIHSHPSSCRHGRACPGHSDPVRLALHTIGITGTSPVMTWRGWARRLNPSGSLALPLPVRSHPTAVILAAVKAREEDRFDAKWTHSRAICTHEASVLACRSARSCSSTRSMTMNSYIHF